MSFRRAPWSILLAVLAATAGAAAVGYLLVHLVYLPETLADQRLSRVPDLSGRAVDDGRAQAEDAGYVMVESGRLAWEEVEEGRIIYQIPPPDFFLPRGDTVRVVVSLGASRTAVPRVEGLQPELATSILQGLGLEVTPPRREFSNVHPAGAVAGTVPPPGTPVEPGTPVTLVLSGGGSFLAMPDVRGLGLAAARDTLELYSLTVGEVVNVRGNPRADDRARIVVSGQQPLPGQRVRQGSAVRLQLGERVSRPAGTPAENPPPRPIPGDPPAADEDVPF